MERNGKVLAIDLGEKRIGLAVSDSTRTVAGSYGVMSRKSRKEDYARYAQIVDQEDITLIVMGLPVPLSGVEGQRAAWVRDYTAGLKEVVDIPVVFWDESFSTKQAEASQRALGRRGKRVKENLDAIAAAIILQDYLDAQASSS